MKKVLAILLSTLLLVSMVPLSTVSVSAESLIYGDANGDGAVNTRDLALLQQYLAGWEATLDEAAADANGDGAINTRDVALLQQYLAGWDVDLGPAVSLPEANYDLDGRGRIFAESTTRDGNVVSVVVVNRSNKWITEETNYFKYVCTDANGNVLKLDTPYYGYLYLGMLEIGDRILLTFELPEGTAKVEFTDPYIIYWTAWV